MSDETRLTADSIDDEDITRLFESLPPGHPDVVACIDAIYAPRSDPRRQRARERCAQILSTKAAP